MYSAVYDSGNKFEKSLCSSFRRTALRGCNDDWKELWMTFFGTTEWLGLNIGFWMAMAVVLLIVIVMNVIFWSMKPKADAKELYK